MLTENPFNLDHQNSSYRADYSTLEMKDVKMSSVVELFEECDNIISKSKESISEELCGPVMPWP